MSENEARKREKLRRAQKEILVNACRTLFDKGAPLEEVMSSVGCSENFAYTVYDRFRDAKFGEKRCLGAESKRERYEYILSELNKGRSKKAVAVDLGISEQHVYNILKLKIDGSADLARQRRRDELTNAVQSRALLGKTCEEIGEELGYTRAYVARYLPPAQIGRAAKDARACIYPGMKKWIMWYNIGFSKLSEMMYPNGEWTKSRRDAVCRLLTGKTDKFDSDVVRRLLRATDLTYEQAFGDGR